MSAVGWMIVGLVLGVGFGLIWWAAFTGPVDDV